MRHLHTLCLLAVTLLALGATACSKAAATCSAQSKLVGGTCRAVCSGDQECLSGERCDLANGVCMGLSAFADASTRSDSGEAKDGDVTRDGSKGDGGHEHKDGGFDDAASGDGGKFPDAQPEDKGFTDGPIQETGPDDTGPDDTGIQDGMIPPDDSGGNGMDALPSDTGVGGMDATPVDGGGDCTTLDEATCRTTPACTAHGCLDCNNTDRFYACTSVNDPPPMCPQLNCTTCAGNTSNVTCRLTGICHPIFADVNGTMVFDHCTSPATATCTAPPVILCGHPMPICLDPYVQSYTSTCYDGCVTQDECM